MNDRALREMTLALGGAGNGYPRQSGFDIVVASEVMAILCLADSWKDLKLRLSKIVVGETQDRRFLRASELKAQGAMTVLLKDALKPNLVQTLEHNPALIHGGPFANIAHGCSSVIATQSGLKLADYVVTEAGFGADVATVRALKYQGGAEVGSLRNEDLSALQKGMVNLERHVDNVRNQYGIRCVVAVNHFSTDTEAELESVRRAMSQRQVQVLICSHWEQGSRGAQALAEAVVGLAEGEEANLKFVYRNEDSLWDKAHLIVTRIYGASELTASSQVRKQIDRLQRDGFGHFPVCIAKTQYSFSTDPQLRGAPSGHQIEIREVRLAAGAEFVVFVCGEIMTMPGLPKVPSSTSIDLDEQGRVIGLF
jgi:formate--tetrahydrofolate ligase